MLFDVIAPGSQKLVRPNYFKGSKFDSFLLALSGYKPDGSNNLLGKVAPFVNPIYGVGSNMIAKKITEGTETSDNIADDTDNRTSKGMIGLSAAQIGVGAITGQPQLLSSGVSGISSGIGSLVGAGSGPNYSDDFGLVDVVNGKVNRKAVNDTYSFKGASFEKGGPVVTSNTFFKTSPDYISTADPDFIAKAVSASLALSNRTRFVENSPMTSNSDLGIKVKDNRVNLSGLSSNFKEYLIGLPSEIKSSLLATSGADQPGVHVKGSAHGKGKAVDFRLNMKAFDYISKDPVAKAKGIIPQIHTAGTGRHIHAISMFEKGGSPLKSGITKEIAKKILEQGTVSGRELTAKQKKYFSRYLNKKDMEMGGEMPFVPYADNDHQEDYFMVDKVLARKAGLEKILDKISFGMARYNERIFDQKANLAMKMIMGSSFSQNKKKDILGDLVFDELKTHSDMKTRKGMILAGQVFAEGNQVTDPEVLNLMRAGMSYSEAKRKVDLDKQGLIGKALRVANVDPRIIPDINIKASLPNFLPKSVTNTYNNITSAIETVSDAPSNIRAMLGIDKSKEAQKKEEVKATISGNPDGSIKNSLEVGRPLSFQQEDKPKVGASGSQSKAKSGKTTPVIGSATTRGLNIYQNDFYDAKYPNPLGVPNPLGIPNYQKLAFDANQATPLSEIASANISQKPVDLISPRPYNNQNDLGANSLPSAVDGGIKSPVLAPPQASASSGKSLTGIFDTAGDILRLGAGISAAMEPVPDFKPSQDFIDRQAQIKAQANQGLTPNEMARLNKAKVDSYDMGVSAIVNSSGGGANQGAVLGSLSSLQGKMLDSDLNIAIADNNKMLQNQQIYDRALQNQLQLDENLYANKVNFINQNRNMGAQLVQSTLQDIENRRISEKSNQLNSVISDYYKTMIDKYRNTSTAQAAGIAR